MEATFWASRDLLGFVNVMNELEYYQTLSPVYTDSEGNKSVLEGRMSLGSTNKFVDIRYLLLRDWCKEKFIQLGLVRTKEMIADILTKNLAKDQFCRLRDHLLGYHLNGVLMKLDLCRQKELKMYKVILKLRLLRSMRPGPIRDQLMENVEDMQ